MTYHMKEADDKAHLHPLTRDVYEHVNAHPGYATRTRLAHSLLCARASHVIR